MRFLNLNYVKESMGKGGIINFPSLNVTSKLLPPTVFVINLIPVSWSTVTLGIMKNVCSLLFFHIILSSPQPILILLVAVSPSPLGVHRQNDDINGADCELIQEEGDWLTLQLMLTNYLSFIYIHNGWSQFTNTSACFNINFWKQGSTSGVLMG